MTINNLQIGFDEADEEYAKFVDKFKPKKTTDDCYTPDNVYLAVLQWVRNEYNINGTIVRPFWPGGDYERHKYPEGCVVVDNPPFSIISKVCRTYQTNGIKFFLFAPYLTNLSIQTRGITHILTDADVLYENGATVNTAFITNLEPGIEVRTAPSLREAIMKADAENRAKVRRTIPKYAYPPEVMTATMIGYICRYGIDFKVKHGDCVFIRALDAQKTAGKGLFGAGYLLSEKAAAEKAAAEKAAAEKAAAEKAAAEKWELSEREKQAVKALGEKHGES